jgi:hypothetical protein
MKNWILLFILLNLVIVSADTVDLKIGESFLEDAHNITLVSVNQDKAIICVNNQRTIFSEDLVKLLGEAYIEARDIRSDSVKLDVEIDCIDCKSDQISNDKCFNSLTTLELEEIEEVPVEIVDEVDTNDVEIVESEGISTQSIILALLLIIVIILGLIVFWRNI